MAKLHLREPRLRADYNENTFRYRETSACDTEITLHNFFTPRLEGTYVSQIVLPPSPRFGILFIVARMSGRLTTMSLFFCLNSCFQRLSIHGTSAVKL